ncbi:hypothetical protein A2U01_0117317, partial [Trifolium medium]|nr:hypothetical protein [Trifolium medium]
EAWKQWRKALSCDVEVVASGCGARRANPQREARSGVYIAAVLFFLQIWNEREKV